MLELINAAKDVYGADPMSNSQKRMNVWSRFAVYSVLHDLGIRSKASARSSAKPTPPYYTD